MIFKALPVRVGDSFLLENNGIKILVDGGIDEIQAVKLLDNERIPNKHIDVLICTHYDSDHIKGILGILKSNEYTFKELWLPEILGSIGYSISRGVHEVIKKIRKLEPKEFKELENIELPINKESNNDQIEEVDYNFLVIINEDFGHYLRYWDYYREPNGKLMYNLLNLSNLIIKSYYSGSFVRWFSYENQLQHNQINFNIYAKNCKQVGLTKYTPNQLFQALLKISKINKESLVFQFSEQEFPDVLFTGDSDLSFCNNGIINLKDNSIVTAPHHGSSANNGAYKRISGINLTYVRSDRSQINRPGMGFINQPKSNKYCTICRNKTIKTKIELNYSGTGFQTNNNSCIC